MKVIFCLPGGMFTGCFLDSWTKLMREIASGALVKPEYLRYYSANVFEARNRIIGDGNACQKSDAQPFGGREYDWSFWIDSDIVFYPEDVFQLLALAEKHDCAVLSGLYATGPGEDEDMAVAGTTWGRASIDEMRKCHREVLPIDYCGWGFIAVRRGVFEALGFPWIDEPYRKMDGLILNLGDDFSFCLRCREREIQPYIAPDVVVGHDKRTVLQARQA